MSRLVLAVARTVTSTVRLMDALEVFRADLRVEVVFWVDERSRFGQGVRELLSRVGARVVTRHEVRALDVGLVLAASENADVGVVDAPAVVLPHGVGFHKHLREVPGGPVRLSGVAPRRSASGRETVMVVTSHRQRTQLESASPGAAGSTVVVRDPFFDRLRASLDLRDQYRRTLGVHRGRRLIVASSTWGEESLWSRWQDLPTRLLAELPSDEYLVAAILHPNVWAWHGPWQVRTWLADALDSGLLLIPADQGWQRALVSADVVIGDHGSVTFYAAALGLPLLLGAFG
ncbi:MAG: hypothetical protein QG671_427, partial [Actinomycetota bacterium]|nr:hypothetical protein [Actinomycetota bacterium]